MELNKHDIQKIKNFLHPKENQCQTYFFTDMNKAVIDFLIAVGFEPNKNTTDDMVYFDRPNN